MKEILITIGFVALAVLLLCVRVILKKNGRFSSQHISQNKRMREKGIGCATSQDREAQQEKKLHIDVNKL